MSNSILVAGILAFSFATAEARLVGPDYRNDIKQCTPAVQADIQKARQSWGSFEFLCEDGKVRWLSSDELFLSKNRWPGEIKKHLGLFGITSDEFAFVSAENLYYQVWNGFPINHGHFYWYSDSQKRNSLWVRTTQTASWQKLRGKKPQLSQKDAETIARQVVQADFHRPFHVKSSILMVSDNRYITCSDDPQYVWIVIGEESTGHLECPITDSKTCEVQCARDSRYGESL